MLGQYQIQILGDPMSISCTYSFCFSWAEGLEKIENLQSHDNTEIYEKAVKILETYWLEEEDEMPPLGDAAQTEFHCGGTHPTSF
ncbi:hypothetical protein MKW92_052272 [Papaver armeniacum]|nr:hypothetical protein MKW92_052272 [Papaver armeniacum]